MLNPTRHVLPVSAQVAGIGQYITLSFTTALPLQHNCRALAFHQPDARTLLMVLVRPDALLQPPAEGNDVAALRGLE